MLQCRIQANRQGCISRPFPAPHVHAGSDRRWSAEGSAERQAEGGGGDASTQHQTSLLLSLFCRWSCSQRGAEAAGWMGRPSKYFLSSSQPVSCAASVPAAVPHGRIHSNRVTRCHVMPEASERSRYDFFESVSIKSLLCKWQISCDYAAFFFDLELENERKLSLPRNYSPAFSVKHHHRAH